MPRPETCKRRTARTSVENALSAVSQFGLPLASRRLAPVEAVVSLAPVVQASGRGAGLQLDREAAQAPLFRHAW